MAGSVKEGFKNPTIKKEPGEVEMSSFTMANFLLSGDISQIEFLMLTHQLLKTGETKSSWSELFCRFLKTVLHISGVVLHKKLERKTESHRSNVGCVGEEEAASQTKDPHKKGTVTPEELDVRAIEALYKIVEEWERRKLLYHFDDTHSHTGKTDLKPVVYHIKSDVSKMTDKLLGDYKNGSARQVQQGTKSSAPTPVKKAEEKIQHKSPIIMPKEESPKVVIFPQNPVPSSVWRPRSPSLPPVQPYVDPIPRPVHRFPSPPPTQSTFFSVPLVNKPSKPSYQSIFAPAPQVSKPSTPFYQSISTPAPQVYASSFPSYQSTFTVPTQVYKASTPSYQPTPIISTPKTISAALSAPCVAPCEPSSGFYVRGHYREGHMVQGHYRGDTWVNEHYREGHNVRGYYRKK